MRKSGVRVCARLLVAVNLLGGVAYCEETSLRLPPFHPTSNATVEFTVKSAETVRAADLATLSLRETRTDNGRYKLYVDLQSLRRAKYDRFTLDMYVRHAVTDPNRIIKYVVDEDPTGSFHDQLALVPFVIESLGGEESGSVRLPLHPAYGVDNLSLNLEQSPLSVELGSPSSKNIGLTSILETLGISVDSASVRAECERCWHGLEANSPAGFLAPQQTSSLNLHLQPNTLFPLFSKAMILKPDKSQDILFVKVKATAENGGLEYSQEFRIPVRFAPPLLVLLVSVLAGASLGAVLGWLIVPQQSSTVLLGSTTFIAVGIAFLVWLLSLAAFSLTDTHVVIGGFSVDPSQIIPAFLISALAAGGTPVVDRIKQVWRQPLMKDLWSRPSNEAATE